MKKIYLSIIAAVALTTASAQMNVEVSSSSFPVSGQKPQMTRPQSAKTASVLMSDDLWYFLNKHELRNTPPIGFPGIICGVPASYTATTFINKCGSTFENPGTVLISGAGGLALSYSTSTSPTVNVVITLYQAAGSPLMPTGAALASCTTGVSTSTVYSFVGGTWTPVPVTGPYALVMSTTGSVNNDKIVVGVTSAKTSTATTAPAAARFGERMGVYGQVNGNWLSTTDVISAEDDREAVLAPFVDYTFSVTAAPVTNTTCNTVAMNYFNTSSGFVNHRQYNVNKLCAKWAPFANTALFTAINPDSVFTWIYGDSQVGYGNNPPHSYSITNPTLTSVVMNDNLTGKVKSQLTPTAASQSDVSMWTVTVTVCNVGLSENSITSQVGLYPNPATDLVTVFVNNATIDTKITVLNALGQVVLTRSNVTEKNELNTESLAKGVYFVRVGNGKNATTNKLIINK